jgi:hypothetical protein
MRTLSSMPHERRSTLLHQGPPHVDDLFCVGSAELLELSPFGFGAAAFGERFRLYSIETILVLLISGFLAGLDQPRLVANLPTPWMGIWERINVDVYLLWVVVLAIALLRAQAERPRDNLDG